MGCAVALGAALSGAGCIVDDLQALPPASADPVAGVSNEAVAQEDLNDPSSTVTGACELPRTVEATSTGHLVDGDLIVGKVVDFEADCAAGRPWRGLDRPALYGHGSSDLSTRWPRGPVGHPVVPYFIDPDLPQPERVTGAIAEWERLTSINFVELDLLVHDDWVNFTNSDRCASDVGKTGGSQDVLLSTGKEAHQIIATSVSPGSNVFVWYNDGMVTAGTSSDPDSWREQRPFSLPSGRDPSDVIGIGIAKTTGWVYAWYVDGTVSAGTTEDLDAYLSPRSFTLASGMSVSDVREIDIASDDDVYTWYTNNTVSIGTSTDLDAHSGPVAYVVPAGHISLQIVGVAIAADDDVYTFYTTSKVSIGTSTSLAAQSAPYEFSTPKACSEQSVIHEIGHAIGLKHEQQRCDRNEHVRVFYNAIDDAKEGNFTRLCDADYDEIGDYNITSIMHYSSYSFSIDDRPTILALAPIGQAVPESAVGDIAIANDSEVYTWWTTDKVTSGTSEDLEWYRSRRSFAAPDSRNGADIVGVAVSEAGDVYTWYDDGTRSIGNSSDLAAISGPVGYSLPAGYSTSQVIGIDIATTGRVYTWFSNGKIAIGTSTDLDAYTPTLLDFTVASGRSPTDVVGIAISPTDLVFAWYDTGDVSAGTSTDLDSVRTARPFLGYLEELDPDDTLNAGDLDAVEVLYP